MLAGHCQAARSHHTMPRRTCRFWAVLSIITFSLMPVMGLSASEAPIRIAYFMMGQFNDSKIQDAFFAVFDRSIATIAGSISISNRSQTQFDSCFGNCGFIPSAVLAENDLVVRIGITSDCADGVAALSSACCRDNVDRPTAGIIWVCPLMVDYLNKQHERLIEMLLIHELVHILGFDIQSFNYFRHPDGTPRVRPLRVRCSERT